MFDRRSVVIAAILLIAGCALVPAFAAIPTPEPNLATTVLKSSCDADPGNPYESRQYTSEGWQAPALTRYGSDCQRLHFTFGPIVVKPGQNDVLVQPVTIEKPAYDGYVTRIRPDLVEADGTVPPIERVHLHHAVWIDLMNDYGGGAGSNTPFFAAGEEKTIFDMPRGYGMPVQRADTWQILYMVHNQVQQPTSVWITYDIDFVPKQSAENVWNVKPVYPVWLDVTPGYYPVFNAQRGFGSNGQCTWPSQNCATFDPWGRKTSNQGIPASRLGTDYTFPSAGSPFGRVNDFQGGSLVAIAGHLHPGGLTTNVDLVSGGTTKRIFTSEAKYWDRTDPTISGGPPTSWDLSMTATSLPRWAVRIRPSDKLRINATYDTTIASNYEAMGIAVGYLAPNDNSGLDVLDPTVSFDLTSTAPSSCLGARAICDKGEVTHGHLAEADNFGGPDGATSLDAPAGSPTTRVDIADFTFAPGDLGSIKTLGVPKVKLNGTLSFFNEDAAADIYHTVTACKYPCTGATGIAFPLADGRSSLGSLIDFDSSELGYGPFFGYGPALGAAKQQYRWDLPITAANGFQASASYTYFCRIHPSMRGVFEVSP